MIDIKLRLKELWPQLILFSFFVIFSAVWSFISINKYLALNATVYDLGLSMESGWLVFNSNWTLASLIHLLFYHGIVLIISPISLTQNYSLLLSFQDFSLTFAIFPLYGIARHLLKNKIASMLITISYPIFFPIAGIYWFDFHYQAFFVPLFITAYYLFLKEKYMLSYIFFFLSGITRFPYIIFPILFWAYVFIENIYKFKSTVKNDAQVHFIKYSFVYLSLILSFGIISFVYLGGFGFTALNVHTSLNDRAMAGVTLPYLDGSISTVLLLLSPFLLLPILSRRWAIFFLPSFILIFIGGSGYRFPELIMDQYTSGIIPFIFLGTIDVIFWMNKDILQVNHNEGSSSVRLIKLWKEPPHRPLRLIAVILVLIVLFGTVYLPFGPLQNSSTANFHLSKNTEINSVTNLELNKVIRLIPKTSNSVLIQNDLPQLLPRPEYYGNVLVPSLSFPYNFSVPSNNGTWVKALPVYALGYTDSAWFTNKGPFPVNMSMYEIINKLLETGNYSILAETPNIILIKSNASNQISYYVPTKETFAVSSLYSYAKNTDNNLITVQNVTNTTGWYGPYSTLMPGRYFITFTLKTTSINPKDHFDISISYNNGKGVLYEKLYNSSIFSSANSWQNLTVTVNNTGVLKNVEFRGLNVTWTSTLSIKSITVFETLPFSY